MEQGPEIPPTDSETSASTDSIKSCKASRKSSHAREDIGNASGWLASRAQMAKGPWGHHERTKSAADSFFRMYRTRVALVVDVSKTDIPMLILLRHASGKEGSLFSIAKMA